MTLGGLSVMGQGVRVGSVIRPSVLNMGVLRVFPGAEGPSATMIPAARQAGRTIEYVTNLNDSGAGSLRAAIAVTNPKVVLFETSGSIPLATNLNNFTDDTFVVGQSAPSPGISLETAGGFSDNQLSTVGANRVVLQHLRFRPTAFLSPNGDVLMVDTDISDFIGDHLSAAWSGTQTFAFWDGGTGSRFTLSECIIAEPLLAAGRSLLIAKKTDDLAVFRNFYCHTHDRTPCQPQNESKGNITNNFIYNHDRALTSSIGGSTPRNGDVIINMMGNKMKDGPNTPASTAYLVVLNNNDSGAASSFYFNDNPEFTGGSGGDGMDENGNNWTISTSELARSLPTYFTVLASSALQAHIENHAGARPLDRDSLDAAWITEMQNGTGGNTTTPGTPPTLAVNTKDWSSLITADPWGTDADGWTNLERQIHQEMTLAVQPEPLGI